MPQTHQNLIKLSLGIQVGRGDGAMGGAGIEKF